MGLFKKHKTKYALTKIVNNPVYKLDSLYAAQQMDLTPIENKINELQKLLDNSIQTINNNFGEVNKLINNNAGEITAVKNSLPKITKVNFSFFSKKFSQIDIGTNTILVKITDLNPTDIADWLGFKPNTDYFIDIYLKSFKVNKSDSVEHLINKYVGRIFRRTYGDSRLKINLGDYPKELLWFISTEKYFDLVQTFNVDVVTCEYVVYEEIRV